jgi:uncharacterized protein
VIVLDTTVLVYAVGTDHPLRDPCRELIDAIAQNQLQATTTVEAIQELTHVRARRRDRADAVAVAQAYVELLSPLLIVGPDALQDGLGAFAASPRLGAFDAVLVAAAARAGADAIVSADRAFATVEAPPHVFPDAAGVRSLLR